MKKIVISLFVVLILVSSCKEKVQNTIVIPEQIKVGVYDKNGDNPFCITDALEALRIDSEIKGRVVSASEILAGSTKDIDVYIFPGGSGRSETGNLGELGQKKIIELVKKQGKGVVGICAGAYVLTETPGYPSLALSGAKAIDIEHDHRGHGLAKFTITEKGKEIFPELASQEFYYAQYYEGPVLVPADSSNYEYTELATMMSDVHTVSGTPKNMTNNRPFIIVTDVENGKTASVVGHPEATPGMRWMIPRLVRYVANEKLIPYKDIIVRPDIYTEEMLVTTKLGQQQRDDYYALTGSKEEKLAAMQRIVDTHAWSAKKWIPPMLRDEDFDVRLLAAQLTVYLERTDAIKDLKTAVDLEQNHEQKKLLNQELAKLTSILGNYKMKK